MECERYRDQMLDVLYGEADGETTRLVEDHQSGCEACRQEMAAFRHLRRDLKAWTLPAAPAPRRRVPAALRVPRLLAMAAGLVMAAGAAIGLSGSEVSYREGRLAFRLGRGPAAAPDVASLLAAQEARHQRDIEALKAALAATPVVVPASARPRLDPAEARLERMIQQSEARQAASLVEFEERIATQRGRDLEAVRTLVAFVDGRASLHAARNAQMMARAFPAAEQR